MAAKRQRAETFGEMLTRLIAASGMSLAKVAKALSVSPQYLGDVCAGMRGPLAGTRILALCDALGVVGEERAALYKRAAEERETRIPRRRIALGLIDQCGGVEQAKAYLDSVGGKAGRS